MKKLICVFIIVCTAVLTVSCGCKNELTPEYTLNAVIAGVEDTDGGVIVRLFPIVSYTPYIFYGDESIDWDFEPLYGYARYTGTGNYSSESSQWYIKSGNVLEYRLWNQERADELLEFTKDAIICFTVMEDTVYRFENTDYVFVGYGNWSDTGISLYGERFYD